MRRTLASITLVLALSVCGCATYGWQKDGATAEALEQDQRECERQGQMLAADYDLWAWRGMATPWADPWWAWNAPPVRSVPSAGWRLEVERRIVERCMEAKGYRLVRQKET